jgi:LysR family transcriptional regulator, glycine cleavage system transcriptional activator
MLAGVRRELDASPRGPAPLPPLNALRAFEAVARRMSFTRAAEELCVTQTAVSHQVGKLEAFLGVPLFRRRPNNLALTQHGQAWARELGDVFARLADANRRLRTRAGSDRPVVSVSAIPSFCARWLVPRLGRFLAQHAEVDVRISSTEHLVDFSVEPIDVGVRYGHGKYPGLVVDKLADDALIVVCAPSLLARRRLAAPEDLRRQVLLHDDEPEAWRRWLSLHGAPSVDPERGTVLTDSSMLVEAAVRGQGVALARRSLALDDLAAGRLALPFPRLAPMPTGRAYYLVSTRENLARPPVAAFRKWLRREASVLG